MANSSGDASKIDPSDSGKSGTDQTSSSPSFPNTKWMPLTTNLTRNPGTFEDIFRKIKDLTPPAFEGAKVAVSKALSSHFQVNHTLTLGSGTNSGYKFGANYAGTQLYSASEVFPIMFGDVDISGNSNAHIIHQWNDRTRTRLVAQIQSYKMAGYQITADYRTPLTTTSLTLGNVDLFSGSGALVLQHLSRVTKNFDAGAEVVYQSSPMVPGGHVAIPSFAAKYRGADWLTGLKLSMAGSLNLVYFHQKANSPLQLGVEFETDLPNKQTVTTFSYQYDITKANATFRGMVDSNGMVTGVIEKRMTPLPFTFMLSSALNHAKSAYRFGFGLLVG